jgi:hypothetical protein
MIEAFKLDPKLLGDILTPEVFHEIIENDSCLTGEALLKVWRRMEMQGDPPASLRIEVRRSDVDRLVREIKREQKLARRAQRAKGGRA